MSTLKVTNIQNPSTSSGGVSIDTSGHVTVDSVAMPSAGPLSNRNKIINGDMRIDQRNAGASVTPTTGSYTLDRWALGITQTSKISVQQSDTGGFGFNKYALLTVAATATVGAGDFFQLSQVIEGSNISDLDWGTTAAKTVTLSFQAFSSVAGTFGGALKNADGSRSYPFTYTLAASTWTPISITIPGDQAGAWLTDNGAGIAVVFSLGMGSTYSGPAGSWAGANYGSATGATSLMGTAGATLALTGVQLEVGSVATPFEHRSYGTELALCQRYYQQRDNTIYVSRGYSNEGYVNYAWPVTMRDDPILVMTTTFVTSNSLTADIYGMRGYILSSWDQGSVSINSMTVSAEL